MGTFVDYNGSMEIPEKKREEFLSSTENCRIGWINEVKKGKYAWNRIVLIKTARTE